MGETCKPATKVTEEGRKRQQEKYSENKQQQELEPCFEYVMVSETKRNTILLPEAPPPE